MNKQFPNAVWSAQYGYIEEVQVEKYLGPVRAKLIKLIKLFESGAEKDKVKALMVSLFSNRLETLEDYVQLGEIIKRNDLNEICQTANIAQMQLIKDIQMYLLIAANYAEGYVPVSKKLTKKQLLRGVNWIWNIDVLTSEHRTCGSDGRWYLIVRNK